MSCPLEVSNIKIPILREYCRGVLESLRTHQHPELLVGSPGDPCCLLCPPRHTARLRARISAFPQKTIRATER